MIRAMNMLIQARPRTGIRKTFRDVLSNNVSIMDYVQENWLVLTGIIILTLILAFLIYKIIIFRKNRK
jgi:hypothetical protein